jgi:hypothetical protein
MVSKEIFDGFCRVVVSGETINSLPPVPPLPVTDTLLREAVPPNALIPNRNGKLQDPYKDRNIFTL